MRKGLYPLPLAVEALIYVHKIGELVDDDVRRHADVLRGCRAALSQGCKASRGGQGPHTGDVYCIVPDTLHVGNLTRSSQPTNSIYEMSITFTRCLQKNHVGRSPNKPGNKVRIIMPACGDGPGSEES